MTPNMPENLLYDLEEFEMRMDLQDIDESESIEFAKEESSLYDKKNIDISSSSAIASLPQKQENDVFNSIELKFLDSTWIQLRDVDNNIIISKLMQKGDEYSYNSSQNLNLTAGNAGNIIISIDGLIKGKAGRSGEVLDSFIVEENFNN